MTSIVSQTSHTVQVGTTLHLDYSGFSFPPFAHWEWYDIPESVTVSDTLRDGFEPSDLDGAGVERTVKFTFTQPGDFTITFVKPTSNRYGIAPGPLDPKMLITVKVESDDE